METPALSIILPTDTFETIAPVFDRLVRQTIAAQLEVIVVARSAADVAAMHQYAGNFAALRFVETPTLVPLGIPRAAGVRAATADFVFIGETHSYLHPDAAEKLLAVARADAWDVVVPGFVNANPSGVWSWSSFLVGYARWSAMLPAGEIDAAPLYDSVMRRDRLLDLPGRLEELLVQGDSMRLARRAKNFRIRLEPGARIDHLNITKPFVWLYEYFLLGLFIGAQRARTWSWPRRLLYIFASPLIPFVLLRQMWPGLKATARTREVPVAVFPLVGLSCVVKAIGELFGYAGADVREGEKVVTRYEVRRIDYVG